MLSDGSIVAPLLGPVRSGNAFEETMARLMQLIRLGSVRVGERLPSERELAEQLGVSRTTLREAIAELQRAGYLQVRRGRYGGAYVRERALGDGVDQAFAAGADASAGWPTVEELDDVLGFRAILEVAAAGHAAAATLDEPQIAALRRALAETVDAATPDPDCGAFRRSDSRLHILTASAAGIPSLLRSAAEVRIRLNRLLDLIPILSVNVEHGHEQHLRLVEAIIGGRVAEAEQVAADHADGTARLLRGFLGERR